ncbi:MAG: class I SAM-dependent methyltransferase [Bacteroidota bacterium]
MNVKTAYQAWSDQYDSNENKTRDLEAIALKSVLSSIDFHKVLEFGCGTGKNTVWLETKADQITAVDFSEAMIAKAAEKIKSANTKFIIADINKPWDFTHEKYDLITYSLVLEHIQDLDSVFSRCELVTNDQAYIYVGELHPFKQYAGSKARYMTESGEQVVTCFTHHISEFVQAANKYGFQLHLLEEWFDNNDKTQIPRILTLLFHKSLTNSI